MIMCVNNINLVFTFCLLFSASSLPSTLNKIGLKNLLQEGLLGEGKSLKLNGNTTVNFPEFHHRVDAFSDKKNNDKLITAEANGGSVIAPNAVVNNRNHSSKDLKYSPLIVSSDIAYSPNEINATHLNNEVENKYFVGLFASTELNGDEGHSLAPPYDSLERNESEIHSAASPHYSTGLDVSESQSLAGLSDSFGLDINQNQSVDSFERYEEKNSSFASPYDSIERIEYENLLSLNHSNANEINLPTNTNDQNTACHAQCLSDLSKMKFTTIPNAEELILSQSSLTLECSLPVNDNSSVRLLWLYQGVNPPKPQCSLTPQETLASCSGFASTDHYIDANLTSGYTKEILILKNLTTEHSGYYYCMVELFCNCPDNPHIMDRTIGTKYPIKIYTRKYGLQIIILIGINVVLLLLIGCAIFFRSRKRSPYYVSLLPYGSSQQSEYNDSNSDSDESDS